MQHPVRTNATCPILKGSIVALDVESDGRRGYDVYHGSRLFCWGYMTELGEYGFMEKTPANIKWIKNLFNDPTKTLVFHHAKYDLKMFYFEGVDIFNMKAQVECTLILSKIFNENGDHDLRYLSYRYCGRDTKDKDEIKTWLNSNKRAFMKAHGRPAGFHDAPREMIKRRNLWDVESTLLLYYFLKKRVMEYSPTLYETERDLMFVCIEMENEGVLVDITRAKKLRAQALKDLEIIQNDINRIVGPITIQKVKKKKGVVVSVQDLVLDTININSSKTQLPAAFRKMGIELKFRTKAKKDKRGILKGGGNWSFDEYSMIRYVSRPLASVIRDSGEEGWPAEKFYKEVYRVVKKYGLKESELLPPLILKFRELSKMVNTYYRHLIEDTVDKKIWPNGREVGTLHCNFNQSEAMTGRFSSSEPNLQNMPRLMGPRECFIPRPGYRNWHFDYEQVEMKLFVHLTKDKDMAKAIQSDIHLYVAGEIYKKPLDQITKEQRKRAKAVNFGIIYGSGGPTLAETLTVKGLPTTKIEGLMIVGAYHRRFPSIRRKTNELKIELHRNGFVVNKFGRRYHIPTKFAYKALNYLCQGTSADEMKRAMVAIWKWLKKMGLKSKIIKTIHDEIVLQITRKEERVVIAGVIKIMENLKDYFVPITVDVEVNDKRWSEKKSPEKVGFKLAS